MPTADADDEGRQDPLPVVDVDAPISVPATASSMPISPANTPRRAVAGEFIHFSERMNSAAGDDVDVIDQRAPLLLLLALRLEHLEHAVGDQEAADDVGDRGGDGDEAQHLAQRGGVRRRR